MLTKDEAKSIAQAKINDFSSINDPLLISDKETIETDFGWIFFYNSKSFLETGSMIYHLAGNGPIMVEKSTGKVIQYSSGKSIQEIINEKQT